jgi:hypothetical protein
MFEDQAQIPVLVPTRANRSREQLRPRGCARHASPVHTVRWMEKMDWAWIGRLCSTWVAARQGNLRAPQRVKTGSRMAAGVRAPEDFGRKRSATPLSLGFKRHVNRALRCRRSARRHQPNVSFVSMMIVRAWSFSTSRTMSSVPPGPSPPWPFQRAIRVIFLPAIAMALWSIQRLFRFQRL